MDLSDFLNSGWESVLVVLGIVGVLINFLSKAGKGEEEEKAPQQRPKLRTTHQASHTQTTKKPAKRKVSQGTFTQNKEQDKVIAEQKATQEKMLRDIRRESDVAKGKKLIKSTSNHPKKARKLRGRLQEAIITKEILDKPVSLRKNHL
ncbi:hypothetical protein QJV14_06355 [Listeria cossartiae subsp. cayugensis]|uniref:hypothetical protein n=1 Tax=Listeria TaxID=1637 RepID=UPI00188772F4|nr:MULTISPECIES: hypothetical protein [Listeria]MBF2518438.1 hypothetical protein [Listeria marthii]MDT0002066.1 hypothetical protein [Listeria cossartiae subsp. cayugensis]MDT0019565.1 hypothetical protein [Listeria cossartiae subsp. cayugensis]MDT0034861.1 hypothetical protein [Listeria cossartiae subsp. cayugensis]MDT0041316.1 hypothetical protein [Listeria cossartiae subsp. cayugensis]